MAARTEDEKPPMVYGLATVYSASVLSLTALVYVLLCLLLGDGLAPSLAAQIVSMYLLMELHTAYMQSASQGELALGFSLSIEQGSLCFQLHPPALPELSCCTSQGTI